MYAPSIDPAAWRVVTVAALVWLASAASPAPAAAGLDQNGTCVGDADGNGEVRINELITAVNNALEGCPAPVAELGTRDFTIANTDPTLRSALFTSGLQGQNVATELSSGPLKLVGGAPDANGVASLRLAEDATYGVKLIIQNIVCFRLLAEGSSGTIDCDGGTAYDIQLSQATGADAPPPLLETGLGTDAGPGAATLLVTLQSAQLDVGASVADCATATYSAGVPAAFTTATATAVKGAVAPLSKSGENFSCDDFTTTDGPGVFVNPSVAFDTRAGGDVVNIVSIADSGGPTP